MATEDSADSLLARSRAGDHAAFAAFIEGHEQRVRAVLTRLLDDPRDVEEALQDTFLAVWRNLDSYRGEAAISTWLYRIATNTALMRARRRGPATVPIDSATIPILAADPAEGHTSHDLAVLRDALGALPFDQRVVVVLHDVEGLPAEQVADLCGISVAATKTRLHRGRMKLRRHLTAT
jgi:RNA polymerase sigma-70 factor (ECF subfamily)